ncbi:MAG: enoyl-CoA hydratase/isomerase family protein [Pseudomonadota bacterium]
MNRAEAVAAIPCVSYAVQNRVATITLNRPEARNAFSLAMREALAVAITEALADKEVRVVVLAAAGPIFSAGADFADLTVPNYLPQPQIEQEYKPLLLSIANSPKPFISAINGAAAGIGGAFAMVCDLSIMADNACIYMAFANLALVPDGGACWQLLHAMGRRRAFEAIVSGARISAQDCLSYGLANRVVPAAELAAAAQAWAEALALQAPLAMRFAKQALSRLQQTDLADAISFEAGLQNYCVRSEDAKEGVMAFMGKRKPEFKGQ